MDFGLWGFESPLSHHAFLCWLTDKGRLSGSIATPWGTRLDPASEWPMDGVLCVAGASMSEVSFVGPEVALFTLATAELALPQQNKSETGYT